MKKTTQAKLEDKWRMMEDGLGKFAILVYLFNFIIFSIDVIIFIFIENRLNPFLLFMAYLGKSRSVHFEFYHV